MAGAPFSFPLSHIIHLYLRQRIIPPCVFVFVFLYLCICICEFVCVYLYLCIYSLSTSLFICTWSTGSCPCSVFAFVFASVFVFVCVMIIKFVFYLRPVLIHVCMCILHPPNKEAEIQFQFQKIELWSGFQKCNSGYNEIQWNSDKVYKNAILDLERGLKCPILEYFHILTNTILDILWRGVGLCQYLFKENDSKRKQNRLCPDIFVNWDWATKTCGSLIHISPLFKRFWNIQK